MGYSNDKKISEQESLILTNEVLRFAAEDDKKNDKNTETADDILENKIP